MKYVPKETQSSNIAAANLNSTQQPGLYGPAKYTSTANDPQIGPQMIPRQGIIAANGVAKNRKWRGLHE